MPTHRTVLTLLVVAAIASGTAGRGVPPPIPRPACSSATDPGHAAARPSPPRLQGQAGALPASRWTRCPRSRTTAARPLTAPRGDGVLPLAWRLAPGQGGPRGDDGPGDAVDHRAPRKSRLSPRLRGIPGCSTRGRSWAARVPHPPPRRPPASRSPRVKQVPGHVPVAGTLAGRCASPQPDSGDAEGDRRNDGGGWWGSQKAWGVSNELIPGEVVRNGRRGWWGSQKAVPKKGPQLFFLSSDSKKRAAAPLPWQRSPGAAALSRCGIRNGGGTLVHNADWKIVPRETTRVVDGTENARARVRGCSGKRKLFPLNVVPARRPPRRLVGRQTRSPPPW